VSAEEPTPRDEQIAAWLAAWHERLAAGERDDLAGVEDVPPELRDRLAEDMACLRQLEQNWPRAGSPATPRGPTGRTTTPPDKGGAPAARLCDREGEPPLSSAWGPSSRPTT
jgi:hypothetical protein